MCGTWLGRSQSKSLLYANCTGSWLSRSQSNSLLCTNNSSNDISDLNSTMDQLVPAALESPPAVNPQRVGCFPQLWKIIPRASVTGVSLSLVLKFPISTERANCFVRAEQSGAKRSNAEQSGARHVEAGQSVAKRRKAEQNDAKRSEAEQSRVAKRGSKAEQRGAKRGKEEQSRAKRSKAWQSVGNRLAR